MLSPVDWLDLHKSDVLPTTYVGIEGSSWYADGVPQTPGTPAMPTVVIRCEDPTKPTPVLYATTGVISYQ